MRFLSCLLFALLLALPLPAAAQGWLYDGSDVAPDPAWRLGVLPNGLRYAVRRNALPAGSVSIRVRMDVGALMERPDERGYAHFLEHMLFRGTRGVPDGEGIRIWQRLGASFGSDSNAFTTLTQTYYALDLPRSDATSLTTATATLAGMVTAATIDPKLVEVERGVILAERAQRLPPLTRRIDAAADRVFSAGLAAADAELAGTEETLAAADAARLRAFYRRWYRPDRATVVMVGDADPALLEQLVRDQFGGWRAEGAAPPEPDLGQPRPPAVPSAVVLDPQASNMMTFAWPQPHGPGPWTVARQGAEYARQVAVRILGRRLTRAARANAPFTSAAAGAALSRATGDGATVAVAHRQGQWRQAMERAFAILAAGVAAPPTQAEIDRELAVIGDNLEAAVSARATARSPQLAQQLVNAIDARLPVTTPEAARAMFAAARPGLTPVTVGAALRALTTGEPRALMTTPVPVTDTAFAAALGEARLARAEASVAGRAVSFADLGRPPVPGTVAARTTIPDLGIARVRFANGVELLVKRTDYEKDRVLVSTTFGWGTSGLPADRLSPSWSASAILDGGVGPLELDDLERLLAGRRIGVGLGIDEQGFDVGGATNARDLPDMLRLLAAAIAEPRFDDEAFGRLKSQLGGTYDGIFASPGGVFSAFANQPLHGGDPRWAYPQKAAILNWRAADWRAFWQPLMAQGPRRVTIVGDVDVEAAIRAVGSTLGAATQRPVPPPDAARLAVRPPPRTTETLVLRHRGDPAEAYLALAWGTTGALADLKETRALNVTAAILRTRLFDRFREAEGGTYTPSAASSQSQVFPRYGLFLVASQLRTERREDFVRAAREIAADLARRGPTADEVARAVTPIVSANTRNMATNGFWAGVLDRDLDDPRVLAQVRTTITGYEAVDVAAVRRVARKWLNRAPDLRVEVLRAEEVASAR